jgi:predicted RNA-binding protein YlxR (DUF448 family)
VTEPIRRCIGCGRRAPQRELVRYVARDGVLVAGAGEPGRGAYTCRSRACFARAAEKRAFARALRRNVKVDPRPMHLYTEPTRNA